MTQNYEIKVGETIYPSKKELIISDNEVKGRTWTVYRINEGCFFEFLAARHGGGTDKYRIEESEFNDMKSKILTYDELLKKYDVGDFVKE